MSHDRPRRDDAIRAPAEAVAGVLEERRLAASSAAPGRAFTVADVAKLLGPSHTQTDDAVVAEAALIDEPGHQADQVLVSARAVVACSSSGAC
jgi:hypothetical protein